MGVVMSGDISCPTNIELASTLYALARIKAGALAKSRAELFVIISPPAIPKTKRVQKVSMVFCHIPSRAKMINSMLNAII